ncbi:MAG TPA: VOC family protein [Acidimicrobiales bacterium]|nr:VOC family protein [Acidimicrobiales bacterium]
MAAPRWFAHANVNARDLEASERFYVSCFDLTPRGRTAPEAAQDGAGFGLAGVPVRWRGVFLADHRGNRSPVVDLLQWLEPPTEGVAYERPDHLGLVALRFGAADPGAVAARLTSAGAPVTHEDGMVVTADPSGTRIEVFGRDGPITYAGLRVNCTDLGTSAVFYRAALHLDGDEPEETERWTAQRMYLPGQREQFSVWLTQWRSGPVGTPYAAGHHAGIYRTALFADDAEASYVDVRQVVPRVAPPVVVALGEGLADVWAIFFPDPDGAVLELVGPA